MQLSFMNKSQECTLKNTKIQIVKQVQPHDDSHDLIDFDSEDGQLITQKQQTKSSSTVFIRPKENLTYCPPEQCKDKNGEWTKWCIERMTPE